MRDTQAAKNQLTNESTKLRQRSAKSEKAETRHKKAEEALRESEETYRQLTESISDVFFEMDKDLRCTFWNKASEKLTGVSAKDAIGKSLLELFPDILITRKTKRVYLDVLRTQQPQTFINEYLFGGKDFFFDISVYPSKHGLSVFAKDITERIQSEEELREKEQFNFALFQHNPIQTIVADRGGRVLKVNWAKRKSGDRLPNIGDVMYKDYAAKHEIDMHAELMECIRSGKKKRFSELKYRDKFLDITIASFPSGAIITSLDITERKQAEEELEDIFNLSPDMIAVCTTEGKFLRVNPSWEKVLGYTTKEVLDLGWAKLIHPDDVEQTNKVVKKQLKGSSVVNFINRFKCKDGSYKSLEWQATFAREGIVHATARDITERKKAEKALKESEEKFRQFFENEPAYCYMISPEGLILDVNKSACMILGYKKEELVGKDLKEIYAPESRQRMRANLAEWKKTGKLRDKEIMIITKDGKRRKVLLSAAAIRDRAGKILSSLSVHEDITERKKAEERYRAIFEQAADSIVLIDGETGDLIEFNEKAHENLGYTREEFKKLKIPDFEIIESAEEVAKHIKKIIREGSAAFETKHKTKDGDIRDILVSTRAISIEGKEYIQAIWSDITERKRADGALRKSENRLKSLFETMAEGVVLIDADGQIIQANPKAARITGLKRSEIEGHTYDSLEWNLLRPDGTAMPPKEMAGPRTLKEKRPIKDMVMGVEKPDGNISWININTSLLKKETGKIDGVVLTFADITKRKQVEEEIKDSQSQLRNLTAHLQSVREEERTHIAREMHDELGQALTAMKMDLSWLDNRLPKDQKPLFEKIKSMSKLADATIQTVKKISTELRPGLLDDLGLPAAIEWQAEEFQTRTGIKCEITKDPEDIILDKDRSTAIFRIFQEALTNVTRHAKATKVKVSLKEKAGKIELKVRDNGKGITEEQVSNPKSFGLIGIMERAFYLDGKVVIKGIQDKGTALTIRIPLPKKGKAK